MYRAVNKLILGQRTVPRNSLLQLKHLSPAAVSKLLAVGAIARVAAPPLEALPGWKTRAAKLSRIGVHDAEQFLDAPPEVLRETLRVSDSVIARWRAEVERWMIADEKRS